VPLHEPWRVGDKEVVAQVPCVTCACLGRSNSWCAQQGRVAGSIKSIQRQRGVCLRVEGPATARGAAKLLFGGYAVRDV
jgi:hypothetical protein